VCVFSSEATMLIVHLKATARENFPIHVYVETFFLSLPIQNKHFMNLFMENRNVQLWVA
jgi:hypothetical protein